MGKNKEVLNSSINVALLQAASKTSGRQHLQKIIENTDSISKLLKQTKKTTHVKPSTSKKDSISSSSDSESDSEDDTKKSLAKQEREPKVNVGNQKSSPKKRNNESKDSETSSGSGNSSSSDSEDDLKQKSISDAKIKLTNYSERSHSPQSVLPKRKSVNSSLQQHFEDEKGFIRLDTKKIILPQISQNTELYFMQIPKTLDTKSLINQQISLCGKTKIHLDGHKYVFLMSQDKIQPNALLASSNSNNLCITRHNIKGNIKPDRDFKIKTQDQSSTSNETKVELLSNIKVRHPIFGEDYDSKIDLDEFVKNKLKETVQEFNKRLKHKDKKKHKKPEKDKSKEEMIFTILNADKSLKTKHTKKKDRIDPEVTFNTSIGKGTEKSKKRDSSENAEMEKLHKKKKVKNNINTIDSNLLELPSFLLKKDETKPEKIVNSTMVNDNKHLSKWDLSRISLNPNEIAHPIKKRKKQKTRDDKETSMTVETYINNDSGSSIQDLLNSEASLLNNLKETKKKKHKHKAQEDDHTSTIITPYIKPTDSSIGNNETSSFNNASDSKKKKKHKRDSELSEAVETSQKKKKAEKSTMEYSSPSKISLNSVAQEQFHEISNKKENKKHKRDREMSEEVETSPKKEKSMRHDNSSKSSLNALTHEEFNDSSSKKEKKKHKKDRTMSEGIDTSPKKKKENSVIAHNSLSKSLVNIGAQDGFDEIIHKKEKTKHKTSFSTDDSTEIKLKKKKNKSMDGSNTEHSKSSKDELVSSDIDEIMQSIVQDLGIKKKKSKKKKHLDE